MKRNVWLSVHSALSAMAVMLFLFPGAFSDETPAEDSEGISIEIISPEDRHYHPDENISIEWTTNGLNGPEMVEAKLVPSEGTEEMLEWSLPWNIDSLDIRELSAGEYQFILEVHGPNETLASDDVFFFVDVYRPVVEFEDDIDGVIHSDTTNVTVRWTGYDNDSGIDHFEIRSDGGVWTDRGREVECFLHDLHEGKNIIEVMVFDLAERSDIDTLEIIVDREKPTIRIEYPPEGSHLRSDRLEVLWTSLDWFTEAGMIDHTLSIDGQEEIDLGSSREYRTFRIGEGAHEAVLTARDLAGNIGSTSVAFSIDRTGPRIKEVFPKGDCAGPPTEIGIRFNERMDPDSVKVKISGVQGNLTEYGTLYIFKPYSRFHHGNEYKVSVFGKDLAGNPLVNYSFNFSISANGFLYGRVVNEEGDPIGDATIRLDNGRITKTDINGIFNIDSDLGIRTIKVSKSGFAEGSFTVNITSSGSTDTGDLILQRERPDEKMGVLEMINDPWKLLVVCLVAAILTIVYMLMVGPRIPFRKKVEVVDDVDYIEWEGGEEGGKT